MYIDPWKEKLTSEQYRVLREKGTEIPFSGALLNVKEKGMYRCAGCGAELFTSDAKFDSGTGWPSFDEPANLENIELRNDDSHGMRRTEVVCKRCGGHLGHVFDDLSASSQQATLRQDGKPAKKRFCINSCALDFKKEDR